VSIIDRAHSQVLAIETVLQCDAVCCSVAQYVQHVAVWCSVLQCGVACCGVLQCVAVCCSVLQCVVVRSSVLQCVAVCCSVLQCIAACYSASVVARSHSQANVSFAIFLVCLLYINIRCSVLQCVLISVRKHRTACVCNTLQNVATHCNASPQQTATRATHTSALPAPHHNTRQNTARNCNALQHIETHCNKRYNTLQ